MVTKFTIKQLLMNVTPTFNIQSSICMSPLCAALTMNMATM
jgi:hypothetical protein